MGRPAKGEMEADTRIQSERKRQLIEATLTVIARHGMSNVTLAKVAGQAGLTAAMVNFHFSNKDSLLLETLKFVSAEFRERYDQAISDAGGDAKRALDAVIDVQFDPELSDVNRLAVWYAFWGESQAREEYLALCGDIDQADEKAVLGLFQKMAVLEGKPELEAEALSLAFQGMLDYLWQGLLIDNAPDARELRKRQCRNFLSSIFPKSYAGKDVDAPPRRTAGGGKWICLAHMDDLRRSNGIWTDPDVDGMTITIELGQDGGCTAHQEDTRDGTGRKQLPVRLADGLIFVRPR